MMQLYCIFFATIFECIISPQVDCPKKCRLATHRSDSPVAFRVAQRTIVGFSAVGLDPFHILLTTFFSKTPQTPFQEWRPTTIVVGYNIHIFIILHHFLERQSRTTPKYYGCKIIWRASPEDSDLHTRTIRNFVLSRDIVC
jgi:hypothetical protein